ncbi:MAG: HEPN domain-containing protein [Bacteroidota bacterium]
MTPEMKAYIESWLIKAKNDLLSAQRLLEIEPAILDTCCFHCQQAIEKYLKAYLIYNGVNIERTHNIIFLLNQCAQFDSIFASIDSKNINAYAVQSRYPDMNDLPALNEAYDYYNLAIEIERLIHSKILLSLSDEKQ